MFVIKRNGNLEHARFEKIQRRLEYITEHPSPLDGVNVAALAQQVISGLHDKIHTQDIDVYSANLAASMGIQHIHYQQLAARIVSSNHHKNTLTSFKDKMDQLYLRKDWEGKICSLIDDRFYKFIVKNQKEIESHIDYTRDDLIDYFGFKTLEKSYLMKIDGKAIERPQDMHMRVAMFLHLPKNINAKNALKPVFETYDLLSEKYFTHASPTMFNAGLNRPACLSCFLLDSDDSIEGIMATLTSCANISKYSGGIGFSATKWRSNGSYVRGTNGASNGIVPFLKMFNETAKAVNQGSRRPGSIAVYLEMHHPDVLDFLQLKKQGGSEEQRCRDLFLGLWVCDLFMKRVQERGDWSFFDSDECPLLNELYGDEYEAKYLEYEQAGRYRFQRKASDVWKSIYESQRETGVPYILFKDQVNRTSNQKNIGIVRSSNLCAEIVEVADYDKGEYACCTLASIALPKFVEDTSEVPNHDFPKMPKFNFDKLADVVRVVVTNLNIIVDKNYYPVPQTQTSNMNHRPLGIGVQGLTDVYYKFKVAYDSDAAKELNKKIFETMYFAALSTSTKLSRDIWVASAKKGDIPKTVGAYSSFEGSPLSQGIFNFEMFGLKQEDLSHKYPWDTLRQHIQTFGVRNSLLLCCMPTASTSQILGNTEGIEIPTSNCYARKTLSGEFYIVNKYLMNELLENKWWTPELLEYMKGHEGSIFGYEKLPAELRHRYRTVWETPQREVIQQSADRQPFVDQSQSLNLHIENLTYDKFTSALFLGWKKGLKTGCYYLRQRAAATPDKFTMVAMTGAPKTTVIIGEADACLVCSS